MFVPSQTLEVRYWRHVNRRGPDECWPWSGATEFYGHGSIHVGRRDGASLSEKAHRVGYRLHTGKDPGKAVVRHSCDNPPCQNPKHLILGTQADNVRDMYKRGRNVNKGNPGERHPLAKLSHQDVMAIRKSVASGDRQKDVAARFGVSAQQVSKIFRGERWAIVKGD